MNWLIKKTDLILGQLRLGFNTKTELEIISLVAEDMVIREILEKLGLSF